jgi:hypothetical protein
MQLNVHIERLIVESGPMDAREQIRLRVELESALGRLLTENGYPRQAGAGPDHGPTPAAAGAALVGQQIAQAVFKHL